MEERAGDLAVFFLAGQISQSDIKNQSKRIVRVRLAASSTKFLLKIGGYRRRWGGIGRKAALDGAGRTRAAT